MKRLLLISLVLISANVTYAQEISVGRFFLMVDAEMAPTMDISNAALMALNLQQENEEAEALMLNSFEIIREAVNESGKYTINEINTLEGCAKYSKMGYPISSLKRAVKSCDKPLYAAIDITIEAGSTTTSTNSTTAGGLTGENTKIRAKPIVTVSLKLMDASGKKLDKYRGKYKHDEKVEMSSQSLSIPGFVLPLDYEAEVIPYYVFLKRAVDDLVASMSGLAN